MSDRLERCNQWESAPRGDLLKKDTSELISIVLQLTKENETLTKLTQSQMKTIKNLKEKNHDLKVQISDLKDEVLINKNL